MGEYSSVSHRRAWEVRVRKKERLTNPSDFDEISNRLWDAELCNLQDLWDTYNYLYVEDPERAQNLAGWGGFFWDLVRGWMGWKSSSRSHVSRIPPRWESTGT